MKTYAIREEHGLRKYTLLEFRRNQVDIFSPSFLNHSPLKEIKKDAKVKLVFLFSRQDIKEQPLSFLTQGWW